MPNDKTIHLAPFNSSVLMGLPVCSVRERLFDPRPIHFKFTSLQPSENFPAPSA